MHIYQTCVKILENKHASWWEQHFNNKWLTIIDHTRKWLNNAMGSLLMQVKGNDILKVKWNKSEIMSIQSNCAIHIVIYIVYIKKSNVNNGKQIEIK